MTEEFKEWMDSDNVEYLGGNTDNSVEKRIHTNRVNRVLCRRI